jgi:hypothetical protein
VLLPTGSCCGGRWGDTDAGGVLDHDRARIRLLLLLLLLCSMTEETGVGQRPPPSSNDEEFVVIVPRCWLLRILLEIVKRITSIVLLSTYHGAHLLDLSTHSTHFQST